MTDARGEGAEHPGKPARARRPLARFVTVLVVLCLGFFYGLGSIPWVQQSFFPWYLRLNASVSAGLLRGLGEAAQSSDEAVLTPRFQLEVRRGCDAIAPSALFAAAVLAFPAALRRKLTGLLVGVAALLVLNLLRIVSLYYTGVYVPSAFQMMHLDIWQPLFILGAMALWIAWALWATRGSRDIHATG